MTVLAFDTATAATVVGVQPAGGAVVEARHDPTGDERPGHATRLLGLVEEALAQAGLELEEIERMGVGVGPGSFTGLRIGVATARALAQAAGVGLVGVSTLEALAEGARAAGHTGTALAVVDARRGEAFAAAWCDGREVLAPAALSPGRLAEAVAALPPPVLAVGDGALRFRGRIGPAGAEVAPSGDLLHRVGAGALCRLTGAAAAVELDSVLPDYLRLPDAEIARRQRQT